MRLGAIGTLICYGLLLGVAPLSLIWLYLLVPLFGLFINLQVVSFPAISEVTRPSMLARAMSIVSLVSCSSIPILQYGTGWLFGQLCAPQSNRTAYDYFKGFSLVTLGLCGALVIAFLARESYGTSLKKVSKKRSNNG